MINSAYKLFLTEAVSQDFLSLSELAQVVNCAHMLLILRRISKFLASLNMSSLRYVNQHKVGFFKLRRPPLLIIHRSFKTIGIQFSNVVSSVFLYFLMFYIEHLQKQCWQLFEESTNCNSVKHRPTLLHSGNRRVYVKIRLCNAIFVASINFVTDIKKNHKIWLLKRSMALNSLRCICKRLILYDLKGLSHEIFRACKWF